VTSLPGARRTLIPADGGSFQTLITSTVGQMIGQLDTYEINVPAGRPDLDVRLSTVDASPDKRNCRPRTRPRGHGRSTSN